jgi:tetratricopeptide (TPR) repeat protein/predicted transcriptional regulator
MIDLPEESGKLDILIKRNGILRHLAEESAYVRDLEEDLEQSRSTISRALNELEDVELVERGDDGFSVTMAARLSLEWLETVQEGLDDIVAAEAVIGALPPDAPLDTAVVAGGEQLLASDPVPHRPLEWFHDALADAERYRAVLPALDDPRHVRLLYEHVVTEDRSAELIVAPDLFRALREEFPRRMTAMAETEGFDVFAGEVPPFGLALVESGPEDDSDTTVYVIVFTEDGSGVHGVIANDEPAAVRWAEDRYAAWRTDATEHTDALLPDPDGGARIDVDGGAVTPAIGESVSVALEREGFVRLGRDYFREEPVADPPTAWRAGLSISEVHTGYAVERLYESDDSEPREITEALVDDLLAGRDHVIVGPPGSGKSTVCKRVATAWYDGKHGTVLYRESGRGRPFDSVEDLVVTVNTGSGHTLVVVEDAVRPEADAIFDAIDRLGDREDVSFLLDARESEWRTPPGDRGDTTGLDVVHMPSLSDRDAERLVEHSERTVEEAVDVPLDRLPADLRTEPVERDVDGHLDGPLEVLRAEIRREARADDGTAPDEVLLLLHRLARYADPLAEGRTSLEGAVADLYDDLADDDLALSVCMLANTVNAAGIEVEPALLYALASPEDFDAVDAAIERLEGRVLFSRDDGTYRTVHQSWSVALLAHTLEAEDEAVAAQRFGDCVTAVLALADEPERRETIADVLGRRRALAHIAEDSTAWANRTIRAVSALGQEHPKLAPLYGDGERDVIDLPASCSEGIAAEWPAPLGRLFVAGGYYERAQRSFERMPDDGELAVERLLGLARVANHRGEYDAAVAHAEECLTLVEDADRPLLRARIQRELGQAQSYLGDFEDAEETLRAALDTFEDAGNRRRTSIVLHDLGAMNARRGHYDQARTFFDRALELSRALGDLRGEADHLTGLGDVARKQSEYELAGEFHRRALDVEQTLGDRQGEANALNNLAIVAAMQGEYGRAGEYFERSLEIKRDLGDRRGEAHTRHNLGNVARRLGEYDRSHEHFQRSLEIKRDLDDRQGEATTLLNLGELARLRGDYDRAEEYHGRCLDLSRELDDRMGEAENLGNLGELDRLRGDHARARDRLEGGLEIAREIGRPIEVVRSRRRLGELARMEGEYDRAQDHFEAAIAVFEDEKDPFEATQNELARGRLALDRGDVDEARERAEAARETATTLGSTPWVARSRLLLGRVAAETGDHEAAGNHWEAALETFEDVGAPRDALKTLTHLVESCEERGDEEGVETWCRRSDELLEDAPEPLVDEYRDWVDRRLAALDAE